MKTLILTEKPSVARDFSAALGGGKSFEGFIENEKYLITWAIGHLLTPFDPEDYNPELKKWKLETLPILPEHFKFKALPQTKKQLDIIKRLLKRLDIERLIVATDAGREGELIARLILNESKRKIQSFRFFTSAALTKEVINSELQKIRPLQEYDRLYIAGRARQRADWLVGMNLSRLATLKLGDLFSVGRVQTAVLGLLVERKLTIEHFIPVDYFELKAQFSFAHGVVNSYWFDPKKKIKGEGDSNRRLDKSDKLDLLLNKLMGKRGEIKTLTEIEKILYPQGLFSLTELQRQANIRYGFSAIYTLELAQSLYEKYKCLSYPRTDSKVMACSSLELVEGLVFKFQKIYPQHFDKFVASKVSLKNKMVFDDSRLTDHHGLIPLKDFSGNESSPEGKIFHLVLKRFISNFLENHRYLETEVEILCENEHFKAKGKKIIEMGFKLLEGKGTLEDDLLPSIKQGDLGKFKAGEVEARKTRPLAEYTEASLLYDMTNPSRLVKEGDLKKIFRSEIGLGTQATRAQIIETLLQRNYIERSQKNLKAKDKGVLLIKRLSSMPSTRALTSVSQTAKLEIKLQEMAQGESDDLEFLQSITKYVQTAADEWKAIETTHGARREAGKKLLKGNGASASFGICPLCQGEVKKFPKSYSCSRFKEGCKFTIWKEVAKKKLTSTQVKALMSQKKTGIIKGFKSKVGKDFKACLILNKEGKVEFDFSNKF